MGGIFGKAKKAAVVKITDQDKAILVNNIFVALFTTLFSIIN